MYTDIWPVVPCCCTWRPHPELESAVKDWRPAQSMCFDGNPEHPEKKTHTNTRKHHTSRDPNSTFSLWGRCASPEAVLVMGANNYLRSSEIWRWPEIDFTALEEDKWTSSENWRSEMSSRTACLLLKQGLDDWEPSQTRNWCWLTEGWDLLIWVNKAAVQEVLYPFQTQVIIKPVINQRTATGSSDK